MRKSKAFGVILSLMLLACSSRGTSGSGPVENTATRSMEAGTSPNAPVKLIFIHHSTGGNWLADPGDDQPAGGLGRALMENGYFVSATNYGWGPYDIGDRTDIVNWPEWFTGLHRDTIMAAVYQESGQNFGGFGEWPRLATDPGGENEVILFKSCFPNSNLYGSPTDPPLSEPTDEMTVANAKAVYNDILTYFATRQDKLFVVITAPPLADWDYPDDPELTPVQRAANARAFNDWLVNDWLAGYAYDNVAVFDYYNVLTSNGGDADTNDAGQPEGNHHRWWNDAIQHVQSVLNDFAAYPSGDSHPTSAGHQKATAEFVPLLNVYYERWKGETPPEQNEEFYLSMVTEEYMPPPALTSEQIRPDELVYVGAFRLPGGDTPPQTFAYGGNAMTFDPDGDSANADAYPGSLFITGHDRQAWGALPDGDQVAEVSLPAPVASRDLEALPVADFLQDFHDVTRGHFTDMEEIPKVGLQYLNVPATGPKVHLTWGQHLQPDDVASQAWFDPDLAHPAFEGTWFIGTQNLYSVNGYMLDIPTAWADAYAAGRYLATGRMRDGGQGGMGPALFAYQPWQEDGSAPPAGTHLAETTLLLYESAYNTERIERALNGYQHPDEWEGGAWLTTASGKSALLFAGTKSTGTKYWYGYINLAGPEYPCVDAHVTDFVTCRTADGNACPAEDFAGCCDAEAGGCVSERGWWSTRFDAHFILYDTAQLAQVALGELESWEPQPYAVIDIDEHLYLVPPEWDESSLGWGDQRRARIGDVAFDRDNGVLYVLELYADGAKPVVHVWRLES